MTELPVLEPEEQRILGSLLEKQSTVPASYPLSANALRAACNQTSSREPIVAYDDQFVAHTTRALKERGLLRIVWSDTGRRTLKYHQILDEALGLEPDERALLTVLLLRGAQAPGELCTRTERLHPFADRGEVEACLSRMAGRTEPLVRELERRAGQHDRRWVHLLGPVPQEVASATVVVDREVVIANGADARDTRVGSSYDAVATAYAESLVDELRGLPFETWLLDRVLAHADGRPVVEVGSGRARHGVPGRRRSPGDGDRSFARDGEGGEPTLPGPRASRSATCGDSAAPPRARVGRRSSGGTPSSIWRASELPGRSRPWCARWPPEDGWSSACTPARRSATSTSGSIKRADSN